jgi:hypothetical protein
MYILAGNRKLVPISRDRFAAAHNRPRVPIDAVRIWGDKKFG